MRLLERTVRICAATGLLASSLLGSVHVSAQSCTLPAQQELANAEARMSGEKYQQFSFAPWPALGTITIPYVIKAKELAAVPAVSADPLAGLDPYAHINPLNPFNITAYFHLFARYSVNLLEAGLFLHGDGVPVSSNFNPEQTRAFVVLNFQTGQGYVVMDKSMAIARFPGIPSVTKSFDARPFSQQWGGANSWFYTGWSSGNTYMLRTHFMDSAFGASWLGAPAIDTLVQINKDTQQVTFSGDAFPSMGVYQPTSCRTLFELNEGNPNHLYDNESADSLGPKPTLTQPVAAPTPTPAPNNQAPIAQFSYKRQIGANNIVTFNGSTSSDPDGKVVKWEWLMNSQVIGTGPTATLSLGTGTTKTVTLRVTDNQGKTGTSSQTLSLSNRKPVIDRVTPENGVTVGSNTPSIDTIAHDDDEDALQYGYHITGPSVDVSSGFGTSPGWTVPAHKLDPGVTYTLGTTVKDPSGAQAYLQTTFQVAPLPTAQDIISTSTGDGYWQVATDGGVFAYGDAQFHGSLPGLNIQTTDILGMSRTPTDQGYWLVGSDGGVFAFGDAGFHGSLPGLNIHVNNIVGMVPTRDGGGYWLVGSDGGVFAFGNAQFYGSMGGSPLNAPVIGIAATPDSGGYWLAAADGGVFAYGDAQFYGSMGGKTLNAPVTDIEASPTGKGYWLAAEDGGVFAYGDAGFYGSMAGQPLNGHITGMSATPNGYGYWLTGCDGGIFAFGDAPFNGSQPRYECRGV